ncbi:MAG: hypothetical protein MR610_07105 [Olsenella sp.]|nr:hypothetical protein [Olsenella sp.]
MAINISFLDMKRIVDAPERTNWSDATEHINTERNKIESALKNGSLGPVYGFDSLLGPLDHESTFNGYQRVLLKWHLLGNPSRINQRLGRWITACKLQQLSRGGSGISGESFSAIAQAFTSGADIPYLIDLDASYSSADVVPGAWWVKSILGDNAWCLPEGDLIALISGNFITLGVLSFACEQFATELARLFSVLSCSGYRAKTTHRLSSNFLQTLKLSNLTDERPQQSVLRRDCTPLIEGIFSCIGISIRQLESAYAEKSANPLFEFGDANTVHALSNSSFLNFDDAKTANDLSRGIILAARWAQRILRNTCEDRLSEPGEANNPQWVQYPKVALAYVLGIEAQQVNPIQLTGDESSGVEDLWDGGLIAAQGALRQLELLHKVCNLLVQCLEEANVCLVPCNMDQVLQWAESQVAM